jgi:2-methylcitrate dehydratase PrpD
MGPQSKLLTAAAPAQTGAQAAFLAARGMTGSRAILEDAQGFWANFAFIAMPAMMTGLGSAWVTDTMAFKPYPGCAYIDTSMDALFELMGEFERGRGRKLEPGEVREIKVEASLLTIAMDAISQAYMDTARLSPTNINFSLSVSLAIGLLAGRMTGAELTEEFLEGNRVEILDIASRVDLSHSAPLTVGFLRELDKVIDMRAAFGEINLKAFLKARGRLKEHLTSVGSMGPREALEAWRSLSPEEKDFLKRLVSPFGPRGRRGDYTLESRRFEDLTMPFGARVRVVLKDGSSLEAERLIPRGGPGDRGRFEVCEEKFVREASGALGRERAEDCVRLLRDFEGRSLDEIARAMAT